MKNAAAIPDAAAFKTRVLDETAAPTVAIFYAQWCPYCRRFLPTFEELALQYGDSMRFFSVDVDACPDLEARQQVGLIPTVIVFDHGSEVARWANEQSRQPYVQAFDALLAHRRVA